MGVAIPAVIGLVSAAVTVASQVRASGAASEQARSELLLAGYRRSDEMRRAAMEAGAQRQMAQRYMGEGVAAATAPGASSTFGTNADLIAGSALTGEKNAAKIEADAARRAWGFDVESDQVRVADRRQRTSTLLTSFGQVAGSSASLIGSLYKSA